MAGVTSGQFDDCDDTPREVDLLTEEHVEDLLDAVECLQGKVEQLQIQCEKLIYEKGVVEDQLIEREKEFVEKERYYEKEIGSLRKLNVKLMAQAEINQGTTSNKMPSWAKTSLDAETAIDGKNEAEKKVKSLQIQLREKDKQLSNLEWQVMDAEATITSVQAERDRLAVELDGMLAREEEKLEAYRYSSDDRTVFSDDEFESSKLHVSGKKNTRRHLSDLTRREDSQIEDFTDFIRTKNVPSLSNNDVPSAADIEIHGSLKRTTNFNNINNVDEFTDFHQEDKEHFIDFSASYPSTKIKSLATCTNWHSFGSDSDSGLSPAKVNQSTPWLLSDLPSNEKLNGGSFEEGCFEDAGDWALDAAPLGSLVECKNESCRSSSSAYFSDNSTGQDPWLFTPDSILDVSTGEELKPTLTDSKTSLGSDNGLKQQTTNDASKHDIVKPLATNKTYCPPSEKTISNQDIKTPSGLNEENCNSETKNHKLESSFVTKFQTCKVESKSASPKGDSDFIKSEKKNLIGNAKLTDEKIARNENELVTNKTKSSNIAVKTSIQNAGSVNHKSGKYNDISALVSVNQDSMQDSNPLNSHIKNNKEERLDMDENPSMQTSDISNSFSERNETSESRNSQTKKYDICAQNVEKSYSFAENTSNCEPSKSVNQSVINTSTLQTENSSKNGNSDNLLLNAKSWQIDKGTTKETFTQSLTHDQIQPKNDLVKDDPLEQNGQLLCTDFGRNNSDNFERTASVRSDGAMVMSNREPVNHQRINSLPTPQSPSHNPGAASDGGKEGFGKLQAYQKWRMSGKKGQPPTKLKISQC